MSAIVNLRHEPKLRDAFEHAHVLDNTVLVDRRTKWGNSFRILPRSKCRAGGRALSRPPLAAHPRGRGRAGRARGARQYVVGVLVPRAPPLSRRGARPRGGLGIGQVGGARRTARARGPVMSAIAFRRIAPDESRVYRDGDHVGDASMRSTIRCARRAVFRGASRRRPARSLPRP